MEKEYTEVIIKNKQVLRVYYCFAYMIDSVDKIGKMRIR